MNANVAGFTEDRLARLDRDAYFKAPSRDWQMAHAMFAAAAKVQEHPLAEQIGRVINRIATA